MYMSVAEFAQIKGLSRGRILHLIQSGDIEARKIGGRWLIDESQLTFAPKVSRALSPKMQRALLQRLANSPISDPLHGSERLRLEKKISELKEHHDPALLLRSWVKVDEEVIKLSASAKDLLKLQSAQEMVPAGSSDPASKIFDQNSFEAYVERKNLQEILKLYLLVKSESPNVILRVIDQPIDLNLLPVKLILNLSHKYGARERKIVKEMIDQI
jgi:excisionase family DNA binding protein